MLNSLKALAVFIGTIIGVGIFGLPYVAAHVGFPVMIVFFALITLIVIVNHSIYGEVCSGTKEVHRLAGYVGEYFGDNWEKVAVLVTGISLTGASLAYLIVGGKFLGFLLSANPYFGDGELIYVLIFFFIGIYLTFKGIKSISKFEVFLLFVLFIILGIFFIKAWPWLNVEYLQTMDLQHLGLPYGVILFSLWGLAVIPELKEMLNGDKKKFKRVIVSGILISTFIYLLFIFIILGVSGPNTSEEALTGFNNAIGNGIVRLGFIFGLIACFTSFITLSLTFKKTLWQDIGIHKHVSWFIASFLPLSIYFIYFIWLHDKKFIDVIGFTGAMAIGVEGIIVFFLYKKFKQQKFSQKINPLLYFLPIFFIVGIILFIFTKI